MNTLIRRRTLLFVFIIAVVLAVGCEVSDQALQSTMVPPTAEADGVSESVVSESVEISTPEPVQQVGTGYTGIRRITLNQGDDQDPAWDPRGRVIAYMKTKNGSERPYDIGGVNPDSTNERVLATGPNQDIGIGGELAWVGSTGRLATNERITFHEYMTFNYNNAPFTRTAKDGDDDAFTRLLQIPGGMGGDGITVSRDGNTVMWMTRTSHNPSSYVITIRAAEFSSLTGQATNAHGTVLLTHSAAEMGPDFSRGFSLTPDGSLFVISLKSGDGYDLSLRDTATGEEIRRLTTNGETDGVMNLYPDFSPDGQRVAFESQSGPEGNPDLYIIGRHGEGFEQITDTPDSSESRVSWSPDGEELAYGHKSHTADVPNWDIYVVILKKFGLNN